MKYLEKYKDELDEKNILKERKIRATWLKWEGNKIYHNAIENVNKIKTNFSDYSLPAVHIGLQNEISKENKELLYNNLKIFKPWRKGPFNLFGIQIDTEWKSNLKWQRIENSYIEKKESISNILKNKKIADIGCNNCYYMYRMLNYKPKFILGFDPTLKYYFQYKLVNQLKKEEKIAYELLGIEHLIYYPNFFDTIFCMGILYHKPDPIGMLRDLYNALAPGGTLIIETQAIPGEQSYALFPEKRYAKVPGTFFIPTQICLINWVKRAKFEDINLFFSHELTFDEQRKTKWMDFQSLEDFLNPNNTNETIEGYPAPLRIYLSAKKKNKK